MNIQCPYQINNDDNSQKTLFACWLLKIFPKIEPEPTTKETYYFLKSSGVSWNSLQNVCQFLTGSKAEPYINQYTKNLPDNEFDLSSHDVLVSFAVAQSICFPEKMESLMKFVEDETGISRDEWSDIPITGSKLH